MGKTILHLSIKFALILFSLGLLVQTTLWLQKKAYQSVKMGLIQIHPINQALINRDKKKH